MTIEPNAPNRPTLLNTALGDGTAFKALVTAAIVGSGLPAIFVPP